MNPITPRFFQTTMSTPRSSPSLAHMSRDLCSSDDDTSPPHSPISPASPSRTKPRAPLFSEAALSNKLSRSRLSSPYRRCNSPNANASYNSPLLLDVESLLESYGRPNTFTLLKSAHSLEYNEVSRIHHYLLIKDRLHRCHVT
jgi:hypothetical protein